MSKLLLRHGHVYEGKAWTLAHDTWLRAFRFERVSLRAAFDADYEGVQQVLARRNRLDALIEEVAADSEFTPVVRRLGCLPGIGALTGLGLAV